MCVCSLIFQYFTNSVAASKYVIHKLNYFKSAHQYFAISLFLNCVQIYTFIFTFYTEMPSDLLFSKSK